MFLKFRGTRGSIPTPGDQTLKYGGNTSCIECVSETGERIIFDAGSGIRPLGLELVDQMPLSVSIFISHTHWDHIQGLPFFVPLFVEGNKINIFGTPDPASLKTIKDALSLQMEYRYFPVRETELKSTIHYETLSEGQVVEIGDTRISCIFMNHPILNFGYKVEENGKSFFFTGDHERYVSSYTADSPEYHDHQQIMEEKQERLIEFIKGVDVLIADSQYTQEEYEQKVGWGHSTYRGCVAMAKEAGIRRLYLTHHDPTRSDAALDLLNDKLQKKYGDDLDVTIAREGMEIII